MIYIVKAGDTVDIIADEVEVPVHTIIYDNQIKYPYALAVGQALYVKEKVVANVRDVHINGYAYPFIKENILAETLEYLTYLSIFSYGFNNDGTLIPPTLPDQWMINMAWNKSVKPILTLTPLDSNGQFNNMLIHRMLIDDAARRTLLNDLLYTVIEKGFAGVDVDFEYILAEDRDMFTAFVTDLTRMMNQYGYEVSVALAPKTSAGQVGLLYEGKDYAGLGNGANSVLLMTYEWGYTYGPPMAVAPLNMVKKVLDYAVTEIPTEKITMGIPNYGYDWALPFEKGVTKAETLGNVQAVERAIKYGVPIEFDPIAQSPYYHYTLDGIEHEVWFEDVRSIKAKLELIEKYNLRGAGYWQVMKMFRANWMQLVQMYDVVKE